MAGTNIDKKSRASSTITDRERGELYSKFRNGLRNSTIGGMHLTAKEAEENRTLDFFDNAITASYGSASYARASHQFSSQDSDTNLPQAHAYAVPASSPSSGTGQGIHYHHHHHNSGIPWWVFLFWPSSNNNSSPQRQNSRSDEPRESNFAAYAGILIAAGVVVAPAAIGAFYLLSELWNNLERLYYNEGYLQAGMGLANIVASLSLSAVITNAVLSKAITAMAISAGFANPISWAFFIMSCVTLFIASCIHLAIQEGIYRLTAHANPDALHPEEPGRFTITDEQIADIKRKNKKGTKGLDGNQVQNVITAIHSDMVEDPSRMARVLRYSPFFRDAETGNQLKAIRTLRMTGKVEYRTEISDQEDKAVNLHFSM
jgi:hypothetical protein